MGTRRSICLALLLAAACVITAAALATGSAGLPTVTTGTATLLTSSSVKVNGTVNPNGSPTTWIFEFGTTTSYGTKTIATNGGSGTAVLAVAASLAGLPVGTTYHYRVSATNTVGTATGPDATFTTGGAPPTTTTSTTPTTTTTTTTTTTSTPPGPPTATTGAAGPVGSKSATLNGTVIPRGATQYWFEYGQSTGYGSKTTTSDGGSTASPVPVSVPITGLQSGILYHFRLVASNGTSTVNGADVAFFTTGAAQTPTTPTTTTQTTTTATPPPGGGASSAPVVMTGTAQGATTSTVTLTGAIDAHGGSATWYFEYGADTSYGSRTPTQTAAATVGAKGATATIRGLTAGTGYHYRLTAATSAGTARGGDVGFTTAPAITLHAAPTEIVFGGSVRLSGTVATHRAGVSVTVSARATIGTSSARVGHPTSGPGGTWTLLVRPRVSTDYLAVVTGGASLPVTIRVRPNVTIRAIVGGRFSVRVLGVGMGGRTVTLERRLDGRTWFGVTQARLDGHGAVIIDGSDLPAGPSAVRVTVARGKTADGYLPGISRVVTTVRR